MVYTTVQFMKAEQNAQAVELLLFPALLVLCNRLLEAHLMAGL